VPEDKVRKRSERSQSLTRDAGRPLVVSGNFRTEYACARSPMADIR
jgi:hypothetical protein